MSLANGAATEGSDGTGLAGPHARMTTISPEPQPFLRQVAEVWESRELLGFLVWRNLKVRYAQTILGASWAVLQQALTSLVLAVVLGKFVGVSSDGAPHFLFYLAAMVPWSFFSTALTNASNSLVHNQNLLSKVYFPRLALPIATVLAALVDLCIGLACVAVAMAWMGVLPALSALPVLPLAILSATMAAAGLGFGLAALNLEYRDVTHAIPFLMQLLLYASPVLYSASAIPESVAFIYDLNPMSGVISGFRTVVLGTGSPDWVAIGMSLAVSLLLLVLGAAHFCRVERRFADVA